MDIHRSRFIKHPASEINALAFSHRSNTNEPTPPQLRLALGRANGNIEIWNPLNRGAANPDSTSGIKSTTTSDGGSCSWTQETILRSGKDRTVDSLAWTQDLEGETADSRKVPGKLRLFSIGFSTHVTEWDLAAGKALRHVGAGQADIWCMAAQPRWEGGDKKKGNQPANTAIDARQEQMLALGCIDGSIVLLSTADGELTYVKTLQRSSGKKPRVMSLAWHGRDKIVAGYSDSMIRVYEIAGRGKLLSNMSLGNSGKGGPRETLVWAVNVLRDGTIVSGDSTGEIKIWDAKNYTLRQQIQSNSNDPSDLLSLAVSNDGNLLLSGDLKRRTTLYQRAAPQKKGQNGRWAAVSRQRHHQGDVKTMVAFESKQMSVVVSGGADATPIINPLRTFGQEHHRTLPAYSSLPPICSAPQARLVMSWWDREAHVWKIAPRDATAEEDEEGEPTGATTRTRVAQLAVQGEESITSADIHSSGDLVAIASMAALKIFHIRPRKAASIYRTTKVELPTALASVGAKLIQFSPDGKWLVAALSDNTVRLCRLTTIEGEKQPYQVLDAVVDFERKHGSASQRAVWGTHEKYDHVITRFAWSSDSRMLVAGDLSGNLDTWVLEGTEDLDWTDAPTTNGKAKANNDAEDSDSDDSDDESHPTVIFGQHWKSHSESLPRLPAAPVVLSFRPSSTSTKAEESENIGLHATRHNPAPHSHSLPLGEDRLLAVTARSDVLEFNVMTGKLSDWSKRNPSSVFPTSFRNVLDQAMGCVWDVDASENRSRVWLYGSSWLWMFDLIRDLPQGLAPLDADASDENKRKRKRELEAVEQRQLVKKNAGAGGKMREKELGSGVGLKLRTHRGEQPEDNAREAVFEAGRAEREGSDDESDDADADDNENEDSDSEEAQRMVALRRGSSSGQDHDRDADGQLVQTETTHHWHTFKYRPIVGVVPIEREGAKGQLEVALVECPLEHAAKAS